MALRLVLALAFLLVVPVTAAAAPPSKPCKASLTGGSGFACSTVTVPLDRSGATPGTIGLRVAAQSSRAARRKKGLLIALAGGPGQAGVPFAAQFRASLRPLLARHRLVVVDQRGTGGSGAIDCPPLQRLDALDEVPPNAVAGCASRLGAAAASYGTRETVEDLEAVRVAYGADKLALMGVSYGTFVAQQYARVHPDRTELLVLDSVVPSDGGDPFALETIRQAGRVLGDQCARSRCRWATADVRGDLVKVAALATAGRLRGTLPDRSGRRRPVRLGSGAELLFTIVAGDLNPFLQAQVPGALDSAARGDLAPLLRLRRAAAGGPLKAKELSAGLFTATSCSDSPLPYALTATLDERKQALEEALDAIDASSYAPFDRQTLADAGPAGGCLGWPVDPVFEPSTDALPDVPALLLSGRLDLRTPTENAKDVRTELPHGKLVTVAGTGHDVLGSDQTGCVATALRRFARGRAVGNPCSGKTNAPAVVQRSPLGLGAYRGPRGVPGRRGSMLFAALDTIADADTTAVQLSYGGIEQRGGCLRAGWFREGRRRLALHGCSYVPGLRVSGRLTFARGGGVVGPLRVDGPGHLDGLLRVSANGSLSGRIGGRSVRFDARRARSTRARSADLSPRARPLVVRQPDDLVAGRRGRVLRLAREHAQAALHRRLARPLM